MSDTNIDNLMIEILTQEQYDSIVDKDPTHLYMITDSAEYVRASDVESVLSTISENPVQNKVITEALNGKANSSDLSGVATSGDYNDLSNKPTIDAALSSTSENAVQNKVVTAALNGKADSSSLSSVATSGDYNDLSNLPTLFDGKFGSLSDRPTTISGYGITNAYTKTEVEDKISAALASVLDYKGVKATYSELPSTGNEAGDVWTVSDTGQEFVWSGTAWEELGQTIDLSGYLTIQSAADTYATKTELGNKADKVTVGNTGTLQAITVNNQGIVSGKRAVVESDIPSLSISKITNLQTTLNGKQNTLTFDSIPTKNSNNPVISDGVFISLEQKANTSSLKPVATSGSYNDLSDKPTIPTIPAYVKDMTVDETTGAITCVFGGSAPTVKTVHRIIGGAVISGSWADNVFTPTIADDILTDAKGFVVVVE